MTPEAFAAFTRELHDRLEADARALGLVALGSMAARDYQPDAWSDHDFFVITKPGDQESFRVDRSWLPSAGKIVFSYRETPHGVKALYSDGHIVEFAVFEPQEIPLARVNRYRVLLDRVDIERRLADVAAATAAGTDARSDDAWLLGQFLTALLAGAARSARGERLSGQLLVQSHAVRPLLILLARYIPSDRRSLLDNLDPFRRFEIAYPDLARELEMHLRREVPDSARGLLDLASRELAARLPNFPSRAADVVARRISGS